MRVRVAHAGDDAALDRAATHPVDVDLVALLLPVGDGVQRPLVCRREPGRGGQYTACRQRPLRRGSMPCAWPRLLLRSQAEFSLSTSLSRGKTFQNCQTNLWYQRACACCWFTVPAMLTAARRAQRPHTRPPPTTSDDRVGGAGHSGQSRPTSAACADPSRPATRSPTSTASSSPAKYWGLRHGLVVRTRAMRVARRPGGTGRRLARGCPDRAVGASSTSWWRARLRAGRSRTRASSTTCRHWSMDSGSHDGNRRLLIPPADRGCRRRSAMVTAIRTVVEGGTETDGTATTATAYLGDYVAFVTVVTDPGSGPPAAAAGFRVDISRPDRGDVTRLTPCGSVHCAGAVARIGFSLAGIVGACSSAAAQRRGYRRIGHPAPTVDIGKVMSVKSSFGPRLHVVQRSARRRIDPKLLSPSNFSRG